MFARSAVQSSLRIAALRAQSPAAAASVRRCLQASACVQTSKPQAPAGCPHLQQAAAAPEAKQQEPAALNAAEAMIEALEGMPMGGNEVHSKLRLDRESVERALELKKQGQGMACPFLHQVDATLRTDSDVQSAVAQGGEASATAMRKVIDDSLFRVLSDLKDQKRYREFRYFKRAVGQHPEVVRPVLLNEPAYARRSSSSPALAATPSASKPGATEEQLNAFAHSLESASSATATAISAKLSSPPPARAPPMTETLINWCSNDYLNMSHCPTVMNAMIQTILEQGVGAGGTRNISGSNVVHIELEEELARLCGMEAALIFNSCYTANLGVMQALGKALPKETIVFSDKENHASLVEGIRFSGLQKRVFRHNDVKHLEDLILAENPKTPKIVVFESVYSMSGSRGKCSEILDICEKHGALSIIDEVHAVGLYGSHGAGVLEELGQLGRASLFTGTLGKAYGVSGGWVAGSAESIDVIRSLAPSFIFTTSMPPPAAAAALASVRHVAAQSSERDRMRSTASYLAREMKARGVPLMSSETHILPVLIGEGELCKRIADELLTQYRIYVQPINYPSVPRGEELLRFTASPKHTREHCEQMLNALTTLLAKYNLLRVPAEAAASTPDVAHVPL